MCQWKFCLFSGSFCFGSSLSLNFIQLFFIVLSKSSNGTFLNIRITTFEFSHSCSGSIPTHALANFKAIFSRILMVGNFSLRIFLCYLICTTWKSSSPRFESLLKDILMSPWRDIKDLQLKYCSIFSGAHISIHELKKFCF